MAHISLWIEDGCMASSVTTLMDAFSIANLLYASLGGRNEKGPLFESCLVSTTGRAVTAMGNVCLHPRAAVRDIRATDCVVISPVLPHLSELPEDLDVLKQWLIEMRRKNTLIASVCTGAFLVAEMGLLDNKKATTNWQFARMFAQRYPAVRLEPDAMLTRDGNMVCTGAATAVHHLIFYLIQAFGSRTLADRCAKALLIDPNRTSQAPYSLAAPMRLHGDRAILKAQKWMEEKYASIKSIDEVARKVGISPRHFKRRFKNATGDLPLKYLQQIRVDAAKAWLETTKETIDTITRKVGYRDTSSFCRLFKQHTRVSPRAYREKFYRQVS